MTRSRPAPDYHPPNDDADFWHEHTGRDDFDAFTGVGIYACIAGLIILALIKLAGL